LGHAAHGPIQLLQSAPQPAGAMEPAGSPVGPLSPSPAEPGSGATVAPFAVRPRPLGVRPAWFRPSVFGATGLLAALALRADSESCYNVRAAGVLTPAARSLTSCIG